MREDHNHTDDPVVVRFSIITMACVCVLILIGKNNRALMIGISIRMLVFGVSEREGATTIHSLMLVSFQTHQGAYLCVVVVVHTVASNSHIG